MIALGARLGSADRAIDAAFDLAFPPHANPWRNLGPLALLAFTICAASGAYLYGVFDTSVAGAYDSGLSLDRDLLGRLARGLHRYAADAFALLIALHLAREAARGHFRAHRAWAWLTGAAIVPLAWIAGVTGFWLAWDARALASAIDLAEWFAAPPWGLASFARNFIGAAAMNDRFFSLLVFMHLGLPLAALAFTWAHLQRLSHVRAWPPAALGVPMAAALAALALGWPATSLGPASALAVPAVVPLDGFYLWPHALAAAITPQGLWAVALAASLAALTMPWWPGPRPAAAAVVDPAHCNACGRCEEDCPFGAITRAPREDGRRYAWVPRVDPDRCAACGICAGACPSSTPLRRVAAQSSGIELPGHRIAELRTRLEAALVAHPGAEVEFACAPMPSRPGAIVVACVAMVPPAFLQYALRRGAARVVMLACPPGDCEHRIGDRWLAERIAARRAPALRATVPRDRIEMRTP